MITDASPADLTKYLRIKDITARFPISKPTIYRLAKKGEFPKPVRMGSSSVWIESEVLAWEKTQVEAR